MSEIKIPIFHIGKVCVAPELPFGGEHYSALKASGVLDRQIRSLGSLPLYFTNQVVVESSAAIDEQLAARGVAPVDWDAVLLSHLDCDHANGLKLVADAKKIRRTAHPSTASATMRTGGAARRCRPSTGMALWAPQAGLTMCSATGCS